MAVSTLTSGTDAIGPSSPTWYTGLDLQLIAGRWRSGSSTDTAADTNPFNGDTLVRHTLADRRDVDEAYAAAAAAQPAWAATAPSTRAAVLARVVGIVDARHDELVDWLIAESGSTRFKAELELSLVHNVTSMAASFPYETTGQIVPSDVPDKENRAYRSALGVVTVISPWSFPLYLSQRSVAPALAVGDAVVLKPASDTPVTGGLLLGKIFEEAGVPAGVLSVVVGRGSVIGDYVVSHPTPKLISFTGSTDVGRHIGALATGGSYLKRIALELGGNSPLVVLDDADVDQAVSAAIFGRFLHQGQICTSTNRIIVDTSLYDEFVQRFVVRAAQLPIGDPADPATVIGPVINASQLDGIVAKIARATEQGATVALGGDPVGHVIPPHVFTDVDPTSDIALEESFGAIVPILRADDEEDAVRLANMSEYGLSSAVFTRDLERGVRFARQIDAGMTHVNDQTVADEPAAPFGGEKNSGLGRFNGHWILDEVTRLHWISVQRTPRPFPF
jgi:acyl-CoA reductase-like NAD-dependent aldehyde dehydrogenase